MKSDIPKQFLKLNDIPMICYSIETFEANDNIDRIVVVTSADYIGYMKKIIRSQGYKKIIAVAEGGRERYDSVYSGLNCIREKVNEAQQGRQKDKNYVFIHDGARPCVTDSIINACMHDVKIYNACVAAVPVKDTIKVVDAEGIAVNTPDRSTLWQIQTPQSFSYPLIYEAYHKMLANEDSAITDDAMVVERMTNQPVKLIEGSYSNIKITTPEDMLIAEMYLKHAFENPQDEKNEKKLK